MPFQYVDSDGGITASGDEKKSARNEFVDYRDEIFLESDVDLAYGSSVGGASSYSDLGSSVEGGGRTGIGADASFGLIKSEGRFSEEISGGFRHRRSRGGPTSGCAVQVFVVSRREIRNVSVRR